MSHNILYIGAEPIPDNCPRKVVNPAIYYNPRINSRRSLLFNYYKVQLPHAAGCGNLTIAKLSTMLVTLNFRFSFNQAKLVMQVP